MPIDFQTKRFSFPAKTGDLQQALLKYEFPTAVRKAETFVNGFHVGFVNTDKPLRDMEINSRIEVIDEEDVHVVARFGLRDNSGNYDDPYKGYIDVVVVVDRV